MTRVVSGAVLALLAVSLVWFPSDAVFFLIAEGVLLLAFGEYAALARASALPLPEMPAALGAALTAAAFSRVMATASWASLDIVLLSALVALAALTLARWKGGSDALALVSAAAFPALYLGLSVGAVIAVRETEGRDALLLLILTVAASDTAQYYSGRLFGRRLLAPAISPKKTVEGAVGGLVFGGLALLVVGRWWLPAVPTMARAVMGVGVVAVGIVGDLFESMLKRSAGLKDSSSLIPGHGGVLDRLDALFFAAPLYYIMLKFL